MVFHHRRQWLATVYGSVRQNRGVITVSSEPGCGATFKIYLPRHLGTAEQAAAPVAPVSIRGQETVLLVEDEAALLKMSRTMLEALGYRVAGGHHARGGRAAGPAP